MSTEENEYVKQMGNETALKAYEQNKVKEKADKQITLE